MKRGALGSVIFLFVFIALFLQIVSVISAASASPQTDPSIISNEIKKLSHYAEDYESGNINYAQLLVYIYAAKQNIDSVLHDIYFQTGSPISKSQIEDILGPSTSTTSETWSMFQQKMVTLDEPFPTWEKVVFDGKEIQIVVNVHPEMGLNKGKEFPGAVFDINPVFKLEKTQTSLSQLEDIVKDLQTYDSSQTEELARQLGKEINDFQNSFGENTQQSGNCEKEMQRIFGAETSRNEVHSYQITINEDENNTGSVFFQYCDGCDGLGRIDLKFNVMSNGVQEDQKDIDKQQFAGLTEDEYKKQIKDLFEGFSKNPQSDLGSKITALAYAWLESNNQADEQTRKDKYNTVKEFFLGLFSDYSKTEKVIYETEYKKEILSSGVPPDLEKFKEQNGSNCKTYPTIDCQGTVIIKGKDANGCPLGPICIPDNAPCTSDTDCAQPLCGKSQCVDGKCEFSGLEGCRQSECNDGDKDYYRCASGEILVRQLCSGGIWKATGQQCTEGYSEEQHVNSSEVNQGCNSISDCNSGEVCSNGQCVPIQEKSESNQDIIQQVDESQPPASTTSTTSDNSDKSASDSSTGSSSDTSSSGGGTVTGNIIRAIISGFTVEEKQTTEENLTKEEQKIAEGENKANSYGRVTLGGTCWIESEDKSYGDISFNLEGKFGTINELAKNNYNPGNTWCLGEVKQSILARKELEKSMNNDFAKWFFESYLASNADQWQRRSEALRDIYNYDTKLSEIMSGDKDCSGNYKLPEFNLIDLEYQTSFGSFKFWEKEFEAKVGRSKEPVNVILPYMTSWIFPSKEVVEQSMINDPGGMGNVDQPYRGAGMFEEPNELVGNPELSGIVGGLIDNYGNGKDSILVEVKFVDYDNNNVIMNIPIVFTRTDIAMASEVNTENVQEITPDITVNADFNQLYDLIEKAQKENKENFVVYPELDKSLHVKQKISDFVNAIELKTRINSLINSIKTTPESANSDMIKLLKAFVKTALGAG